MVGIRVVALVVCVASLVGCARGGVREGAVGRGADALVARRSSLVQSRAGFKTALREVKAHREAAVTPPVELLRLVSYPTAIGPMRAYVSPPPGDGVRRPIVIWRAGGFSNGIGEFIWKVHAQDNDQSASQYMREGLLMMYPSVRGAHDNPGQPEVCFGEVDDMRAAIAYARTLPHVDPQRIYLGGHSTGATLALLTAATLPEGAVRGVIALGPIDDISGYEGYSMPFDMKVEAERRLRSPARWLDDIRTPTWIIEGEHGNSGSVQAMRSPARPLLHGHVIPGVDHFAYLAGVNALIASKIRVEAAGGAALRLTQAELSALVEQGDDSPAP